MRLCACYSAVHWPRHTFALRWAEAAIDALMKASTRKLFPRCCNAYQTASNVR
jgi:hypothetical protein